MLGRRCYRSIDLTFATLTRISHDGSIDSALVRNNPHLTAADIIRVLDRYFDITAFTFKDDFHLPPANWQAGFHPNAFRYGLNA